MATGMEAGGGIGHTMRGRVSKSSGSEEKSSESDKKSTAESNILIKEA